MSNAPFVKFIKEGLPEIIAVPKSQHIFVTNACLTTPFEASTTLTMDVSLEQDLATINDVHLCILSPITIGGPPHASMSIPLQRGRKYTFKVDGPNTICLFGHYGSQAVHKAGSESMSLTVRDKNRYKNAEVADCDSASAAGPSGMKRKVEEVSEGEGEEYEDSKRRKGKGGKKLIRHYVGAPPPSHGQ
ncbi:hypothetical protein VKT23_012846 [Stygiomarasmius scandens]|uniref:Nucleoplasmin-like domain-containing protein n=1 Tax=Marasmiellus scandens TaxID=2682957 RepID=A0ABR1J8H0_9AGAR